MAAAGEGQVFHNRLTHVLKVAQISRGLAEHLLQGADNKTLAEKLGGLDPDVAEAAALAHDLGHPPFGHIAEKALNRLVMDLGVLDGFEGNAQSFRIVTKLAVRSTSTEGLNLTRATLTALLKYPWFRSTGEGKKREKWGAYHSEESDFAFARGADPNDVRKTLEAEVMDWSDDVAYSVYDMEDFYKAGKIPLDRLFAWNDGKPTPEGERFLIAANAYWRKEGQGRDEGEVRRRFLRLASFYPFEGPYCGSAEQRATLRAFTSTLVGDYIRAVTLNPKGLDGEIRIRIEPEVETEVAILKRLTWHYVINDPALATQQHGFRRVVERLFKIFCDASKVEGEWGVFPVSVRPLLKSPTGDKEVEPENVRVVADFIASMTEQQALEMYQRLEGISFGSLLKNIV